MKYTMVRPCAHCPFRHDIPGYLSGARATEIATSLLVRQQSFPCHETTVPDEEDDSAMRETDSSQHCAGAMIMLEHMERPNQMMRICERLGAYDRRKLDMSAPVFESTGEFIEHHSQVRV